MSRYTVSFSRRIGAPAARVYEIIADYRNGHPRIIPPEYFQNLVVEKGGVGAGTVIRFESRVFGTTRAARATVTEPEPGRVLTETIEQPPIATSFIVQPGSTGRDSEVTISSQLDSRSGLLGLIERKLTTAYLRRVYARELALLDAYASANAGANPGGNAGTANSRMATTSAPR